MDNIVGIVSVSGDYDRIFSLPNYFIFLVIYPESSFYIMSFLGREITNIRLWVALGAPGFNLLIEKKYNFISKDPLNGCAIPLIF